MTLADTLHRYRIAGFFALAGLVVGLGLLAWREGPRLPEAYRYRFGGLLEARSETRRSAYQAEIAFYQERLRRNPGSGLDLAALAGVYLKKGRVTGQSSWYLLAQQAAERSLEALPFFNTGALLVLAEIAEAQHDFGRAARIAGQILKEERSNPAARALLASVYLAQGRLEPAERVAEELAAQNPTPGYLVQRALVRLAVGADEKALSDFRQAVGLEEPDDFYGAARTRSLLGRYHLRHGEVGLARGLLEEAMRIAPNYPLALLYLAELETRQGRYRAAEKLYQRILPQDRQTYLLYDHAAYTGLARLARLQGSPREEAAWERAESVLRREIGQGALGHRRELARLLLERGRPDDLPEALRLAQAELKVRQDSETLEVLAWALERGGRLEEAQRVIERALATGRREASLYHRAARIADALGQQERAERYGSSLRTIDPAFDPARAGVDSLPVEWPAAVHQADDPLRDGANPVHRVVDDPLSGRSAAVHQWHDPLSGRPAAVHQAGAGGVE